MGIDAGGEKDQLTIFGKDELNAKIRRIYEHWNTEFDYKTKTFDIKRV